MRIPDLPGASLWYKVVGRVGYSTSYLQNCCEDHPHLLPQCEGPCKVVVWLGLTENLATLSILKC